MVPTAEIAHWVAAAVALLVGLLLIAEVIVGSDVFRRRVWRAYLFPGLVLGLSIMIFYLNVDVGVYGTIWIMLVAYITRFMPYGLRYATGSMLQIHQELERDAALELLRASLSVRGFDTARNVMKLNELLTVRQGE